MNKKAFSMIEILISVSIIIILAIVATTTSNNLKNNSNNSKVVSDLNTIENSLVSFKEQSGSLPLPNWNNNFFDKNWSYVHSFTSTWAFWVYGKFTENSLEKRFLDITPLDPRTNQYYSYGVTKDSNQFEIAWVIWEKDNYISKIVWDYTAEDWLYSIIREYNWPNFISDKSTNLPYNPEEKVLIATDTNWNIYKKWDTINNNTWNNLEIFFSDWSTSIITPWTIVNLNELDFPKENNLVSKINLFLQAWSIWTKATRLWEESSFDIVTSDTTASVRWTIFKVEVLANSSTEVHVIKWKVEVIDNRNTIAIPIEVLEWEPQKTKNSTKTIIEDVTNPVIIEELFPIHVLDNSLAIGTITEVIKEKIEIDHEIKDCYLEDQLVRNLDSIKWYTQKYVSYPGICTTPIERTCENWTLTWNNNFKYKSCIVKMPNQCDPYNANWFVWDEPINIWDETVITKSSNIQYQWYNVWTKNISITVKCKDWIEYEIIDESENNTCNTWNWFTDDGDGSCICESWKNFFEWGCYENPFGGDYELVKIVDEINNTTGYWFNSSTWYNNYYYWLTNISGKWKLWIDLWWNFGLVFDTISVSTSSELIYFYDFNWPKKYLSSQFWKIRLFDNNGIVIRNSNTLSSNKNIQIQFEWNSWNEISWILSISQTWTNTIDFNWNYNLKLINVENIRIYKKNTNPSAAQVPTIPEWVNNWYGCSSCPNWYYKTWSSCLWYKYKRCNWVTWENICEEKISCSRWYSKEWSWTYIQ